jgi:hypothetical protein
LGCSIGSLIIAHHLVDGDIKFSVGEQDFRSLPNCKVPDTHQNFPGYRVSHQSISSLQDGKGAERFQLSSHQFQFAAAFVQHQPNGSLQSLVVSVQPLAPPDQLCLWAAVSQSAGKFKQLPTLERNLALR